MKFKVGDKVITNYKFHHDEPEDEYIISKIVGRKIYGSECGGWDSESSIEINEDFRLL